MISDQVYDFCRSPTSVSSELAKNPAEAPGDIAKRLYGSIAKSAANGATSAANGHGEPDLERAFDCGKWGSTRPSDLFLKVCLALF